MAEPERTRPASENYVEDGHGGGGPGGRRRALVVVAAAAVVAAMVFFLARPDDGGPERGDNVEAGAAAEVPSIPTSIPLPPRVELALPAGWQTLLADGEHLVVATTPLDDRDLYLAVLARDDAAFAAFPPTGAVFVVGGDRLKAKYVGASPSAVVTRTENGVEILEEDPSGFVGPGPALALGPPRSSPEG